MTEICFKLFSNREQQKCVHINTYVCPIVISRTEMYWYILVHANCFCELEPFYAEKVIPTCILYLSACLYHAYAHYKGAFIDCNLTEQTCNFGML